MTYASAGNPGLPVWVGIIVSFLVLVGIVFVMKVGGVQSRFLVLVGIVFVMKVGGVQLNFLVIVSIVGRILANLSRP